VHSIRVEEQEETKARRFDVFGLNLESAFSFAHGRHECSALDTIHTSGAVPTQRYLHNHFNAACKLSRTCIC
jgi:hypothetical protein